LTLPTSKQTFKIKKGCKARAVWDHTDEDGAGTYISFQTGDVITVLQQEDTGWWLGYFNEQIGRFPYNYVEILQDESPSPASSNSKNYKDLIKVLYSAKTTLCFCGSIDAVFYSLISYCPNQGLMWFDLWL